MTAFAQHHGIWTPRSTIETLLGRSLPGRHQEHDASSVVRDFDAAKREYHEPAQAFLNATDPSNRYMRRRPGLGGSGDWQVQPWQLWQAREISYDMCRNDDLPGQLVAALVDAILGGGFRLEPQTGDAGLNTALAEAYTAWAEDAAECDLTQEADFATMTWQTVWGMIAGGDHFAIGTNEGALQLVEPSQCVSPGGLNASLAQTSGSGYAGLDPIARTFNGVRISTVGGIEGYHFAQSVPVGPYAPNPDYYPKRDAALGHLQTVFHLYFTPRSSQHRGIPWLVPAMPTIGMVDDADFAMLLKAQFAASIAGVMERAAGTTGGTLQLGTTSVGVGQDGQEQNQTKIKMGALVEMPPGAKLAGFSPNVPNSEHLAHTKYQLKKVGASMHVPIVMMLLDASETNFSGFRGAMDTARQTWRRIQRLIVSQWHSPVYRWWLVRRAATMLGTSPALRAAALNGTLFKHKFVPPAWKYIQPLDDAKADETILQNRLDSPRGVAHERGKEHADIASETAADNAQSITAFMAAADAVNAAHPDDEPVTWRDVAGISLGTKMPGATGTAAAEVVAAPGQQPPTDKAPTP